MCLLYIAMSVSRLIVDNSVILMVMVIIERLILHTAFYVYMRVMFVNW